MLNVLKYDFFKLKKINSIKFVCLLSLLVLVVYNSFFFILPSAKKMILYI